MAENPTPALPTVGRLRLDDEMARRAIVQRLAVVVNNASVGLRAPRVGLHLLTRDELYLLTTALGALDNLKQSLSLFRGERGGDRA